MTVLLLLFLGFSAGPALVVLMLLASSWFITGWEVACRVCGYTTGPSERTRRLVARSKWLWHKATTRHHTRWYRNRPGLPR